MLKNDDIFDDSSEESTLSLSGLNLNKQLASLLLKLKDEWIELKDTLTLDEVEQFGEKVLHLGLKFQNQQIIQYGKEVKSNSSKFDLDLILDSMNKFETILDKAEGVINV